MDLQAGIVGTKLFGAVDELEDGSYVATVFHHIFGVPIVFQGTYLVLGFDGQHLTGLRIPMSWKSVLFALVRTVLFFPMVIGVLAGIVAFLDRSWNAFGFAIGAIAVASLGFFVTYKLGSPTHARKAELRSIMQKTVQGAQSYAHQAVALDHDAVGRRERSAPPRKGR